MATTKHKALASVTVGGVSLSVIGVPTGTPKSVETDSLAAWGDQTATQIARALTKLEDLTLQCYDEGQTLPVEGTTVTLTVAATYSDGGTGTATRSLSEPVIVKSVTRPTIEYDGTHAVVIQIVLAPVGGYDITPAQTQQSAG